MSTLIPNLETMSMKEKLQAIADIRESLGDNRDEIESPQWHLDLLQEREDRYRAGLEIPIPWDVAKQKLMALCNR